MNDVKSDRLNLKLCFGILSRVYPTLRDRSVLLKTDIEKIYMYE
jgi:hypothetical protein